MLLVFMVGYGVMSQAIIDPYRELNWDSAVELAKGIADSITDASPDADVALFVPYVFIDAASTAAGSKLTIGAEVGYYF